MTDQDNFTTTVVQVKGFRQFVDGVSPRAKNGVQPVFLAEAFLVLQILWEIYQFVKKMGWLEAFFAKRKVKQAMRAETKEAKAVELQTILDGYRKVVPVAKTR
jgi:hypothetical protein